MKTRKPLIWFFVVFAGVIAVRLFFYFPGVWHNDAFDFLRAAERTAATGVYQAAHWPDYPGWVVALAVVAKAVKFFNPSADAFEFIFFSQLVAIGFSGLAAATFLLIARRFSNDYFTTIFLTLIFVFNPVLWRWGTLPMSDVPALAFILASFLFFLKFWEGGKRAQFFAAAALLGAAALFRLPSLFLLPIYAGAFAAKVFYGRGKLFNKALLEEFFAVGGIAVGIPLVIAVAAYGPFWDLFGRGPSAFPTLEDMGWTLRILLNRDLGWLWIFAAFAGSAAGISGAARSRALMCMAAVAFTFLYISGWYGATGRDVERYLIPAIPFAILSISFLFLKFGAARKRLFRGFFAVLVFIYGGLVLSGFSSGDTRALEGPASVKKFILLPRHYSSETRALSDASLNAMARDDVLARADFPEFILLNDAANWSLPHFFLDYYGMRSGVVIPVERAAAESWSDQFKARLLLRISETRKQHVFVHPSLSDVPGIKDVLAAGGYFAAGDGAAGNAPLTGLFSAYTINK